LHSNTAQWLPRLKIGKFGVGRHDESDENGGRYVKTKGVMRFSSATAAGLSSRIFDKNILKTRFHDWVLVEWTNGPETVSNDFLCVPSIYKLCQTGCGMTVTIGIVLDCCLNLLKASTPTC